MFFPRLYVPLLCYPDVLYPVTFSPKYYRVSRKLRNKASTVVTEKTEITTTA